MTDLTAFEIITIDENTISPVKHKDLEGLYDDKLVKGPARYIYDEILVNAKSKGCCFCTHEEPTELDHYLAKTKFSEFSVNPLNLIPACHRCNKAKRDYSPSNLENSFIHPYFENIADELLWLKAKIIYQDDSPVIEYSIFENLDSDQRSRFEFQFYKLELHERYSRQAAREISNREYRWRKVFDERGARYYKTMTRLRKKKPTFLLAHYYFHALH